MDKKTIRADYRTKREALSDDLADKLSLDISNQALALPVWHLQTFHLFLPIVEKKEVDTEVLLNVLLGRDKTVVVSKSDFTTGTMQHFVLEEHTLIRKNAYGIPEPVSGIPIEVTDIDVVFVPLLAFDVSGHRIGYGKGFYDRFLAECRKDVVKVGLSFFAAEPAFADVLDTDVALDYCVTPERVYRF